MTAFVPSENRVRFDSLDSLRFLAATAVLISHAEAMQPWPQLTIISESGLLHPKSAVAFFFALSGFVLHLSCRGTLPTLRSFGLFMVRRWFRIYPLYFVSLIFSVIVLSCLPLKDCPRFDSDSAGAEVLLRNHRDIIQWVHHAFLITPGLDMQFLNPPIWTLAAEIRIALIFPWLSFIFNMLSFSRGIILMTVMFVLAPWVAQKTLPTVALIPLFGLGTLAAQHRHRFTKMSGSSAWLMMLAGVLIYSFSSSLRGNSLSSQSLHMYLAGFGSIILLLAVLQIALLRQLLEHRWLVFGGRASYGVYILHFPLLMGIAYYSWRSEWSSWLFMLVGFVVVVAIASALYWLFELPMIRAGRIFSDRYFSPNL